MSEDSWDFGHLIKSQRKSFALCRWHFKKYFVQILFMTGLVKPYCRISPSGNISCCDLSRTLTQLRELYIEQLNFWLFFFPVQDHIHKYSSEMQRMWQTNQKRSSEALEFYYFQLYCADLSMAHNFMKKKKRKKDDYWQKLCCHLKGTEFNLNISHGVVV